MPNDTPDRVWIDIHGIHKTPRAFSEPYVRASLFEAPDADLVPLVKMEVDQLLAAEVARLTAQRDALRAACNQARLAFAGYVSAQSAINMLDALNPTGDSA